MEQQISYWCQKIMENWDKATVHDYAFATAWIIVVGFLISKLSAYSVK